MNNEVVEVIKIIQQFNEAHEELERIWSDIRYKDILDSSCDKILVPFPKSFDEYTAEVTEWCSRMISLIDGRT